MGISGVVQSPKESLNDAPGVGAGSGVLLGRGTGIGLNPAGYRLDGGVGLTRAEGGVEVGRGYIGGSRRNRFCGVW